MGLHDERTKSKGMEHAFGTLGRRKNIASTLITETSLRTSSAVLLGEEREMTKCQWMILSLG